MANNVVLEVWTTFQKHSGGVYSRAGVDFPQSLVFETVVPTKTVGGAERLVALSTWMFLQYLQCKMKAP